VARGNLKDFVPENLAKLCEADNRQIDRLSALIDRMLRLSFEAHPNIGGLFDLLDRRPHRADFG
jgi:hypothetical protein